MSGAITSWPWGIEQTAETLWVGPLRPDGMKVEQVVVGLNFDAELTTAAKVRQLANSRLIAAAPELLEALIELRSFGCPICSGDCGSANPPVASCPMQKASAAIAKAEGRHHD